MRKALFLFMVFGLVGLMCGCEVGTTALSESDISDDYNEEVKKSLRKLILTGNCKECPFVGVDISGKDLSHKDLTGADLSKANLSQADLKFANLKDADLNKANLSQADLSDALLLRADLSYAKLIEANLRNADLTGASMKEANLNGAILCNTKTPWGLDNSGCK